MTRIFGTDGVRGQANVDVTAELALDLSVAAAHVLVEGRPETGLRPRALVGRDPRASGEFLAAAVCAGLASAGRGRPGRRGHPDARPRAPRREPAGRRPRRHDLGLAQPDARQRHQVLRPVRPQARRRRRGRDLRPGRPAVAAPGRRGRRAGCGRDAGSVQTYAAHCVASLPGPPAAGRAAPSSSTAPTAPPPSPRPLALRTAGADGPRHRGRPGRAQHQRRLRLHPPRAAAATPSSPPGADVGVAFDGDADRCLAVDHTGAVVDGDQILAVLALAMRERGRAARGHGRRHRHEQPRACTWRWRSTGITLVTTGVGDRYVLEAMREGGWTLGGEQSGHVVLSRLEHHGRRAAHRPAAAAPGGRDRPAAGRARRGRHPAAAGPAQRRRGRQGRRRPRRGRHRGRGRRPSASSAAPGGCCCGPRAPSRSCGSWSRRPTSRAPSATRTPSPASCGSGSSPRLRRRPAPPAREKALRAGRGRQDRGAVTTAAHQLVTSTRPPRTSPAWSGCSRTSTARRSGDAFEPQAVEYHEASWSTHNGHQVAWVVVDEDRVVALAKASLPRRDNTHLVELELGTDPGAPRPRPRPRPARPGRGR